MLNNNRDKFEFEHSKALTRKEKKFYIRIFDELGKLMSDETSKKGNNKEQRIKALEDNLYKVIQQYPELLHIQKSFYQETTIGGVATWYHDFGHTFLWLIRNYELHGLVEKLCEDVETYKLHTFGSDTLLFDLIPKEPDPKYQHTIDTYNNKMQKFIVALQKYPELLSLKNQWGANVASEIVSEFEPNSEYLKPFMPFILSSLNNPEIATQQNNHGYNLGMLCARYKHQKLFEIAYQNPTARMQKNIDGETMEMIANNNGLIVPPLSDEQVYNFYDGLIKEKIDEICK